VKRNAYCQPQATAMSGNASGRDDAPRMEPEFWEDPSRRSRSQRGHRDGGISNSGSMSALSVAPLAVPLIAVAWGWQYAFLFTGILNGARGSYLAGWSTGRLTTTRAHRG